MDDILPAAVCESLRQSHERNVHKSLFLNRELIRILDCVEPLGVEVIPYKGIVMSEAYYGDTALRQSGDLDVFVRTGDVARIKSAVRELGYTPRLRIPAEAEADYLSSGYEYTFDSPAGKNLLELQWALQPRFHAVDFDMEGMFERAVSFSLSGRPVRTPSAEDLLIILAVHAAKHVWGRLIWLCDIAQISKRELDWERIRTQAHELGIERILRVTLLLAKRMLGREIPSAIEEAVVADRAAAEFARQIAESMALGVVYEEEKMSYFRLMMGLRERRADQVKFLWRLAVTPGPGEWETVRLPRDLFPLYRVIRVGRLAARFARG
jgi:hypothetical protein